MSLVLGPNVLPPGVNVIVRWWCGLWAVKEGGISEGKGRMREELIWEQTEHCSAMS